MSQQTQALFLQALRSLYTIEDAFVVAGVHPSTGMRWLQKGRAQARGEYREFYEATEKAKALAKGSLVTTVMTRAKSDPRMALKILERRYPGEWGITRKLELEDKTPPNKRDIRTRVVQRLEQIEKRLTAPPIEPGALKEDEEADE